MRATANCTLIVECVYFHQWNCQCLPQSPNFSNPNPLLLITAQFKNISSFQLCGQIGTKSSIICPDLLLLLSRSRLDGSSRTDYFYYVHILCIHALLSIMFQIWISVSLTIGSRDYRPSVVFWIVLLDLWLKNANELLIHFWVQCKVLSNRDHLMPLYTFIFSHCMCVGGGAFKMQRLSSQRRQGTRLGRCAYLSVCSYLQHH